MNTEPTKEVNFLVSYKLLPVPYKLFPEKTYILSIDKGHSPHPPSPWNSMSESFPSIAHEIKFCIARYVELARKNGGSVPKFNVKTAPALPSSGVEWLYGGGQLLTPDEQRMLQSEIETGFRNRSEKPAIEYFSPNGSG